MKEKIDLTGQTFGRLTVINAETTFDSKNNKIRKWNCICKCGKNKLVLTSSLINNKTKSCGCLRKETSKNKATKHNHRYTTEYRSWQLMKSRCLNPNNKNYKTYGNNNIKICDKWLDKKEGFKNFIQDLGYKPTPKHTLDRINPYGNYEPSNCRWADKTIQAINTRNKAKNNTSGTKGVHWCKRDKKWIAQIRINYKTIKLGRFNSIKEAIDARKKGEEKYFKPLLSDIKTP